MNDTSLHQAKTNSEIVNHYSDRDRADQILQQARRLLKNDETLTTTHLAPFDQMHIGRETATERFFTGMSLRGGMHILDIGSGLGGPARHLADTQDVHITGIDLTPALCQAAEKLTEAAGLDNKIDFRIANACDMPFDDACFDASYTIHVAMNIATRADLYREIARTLKPNGIFALYDIMLCHEDKQPRFPMPWADTAQTSHLLTEQQTIAFLQENGFTITARQSYHDDGLQQVRRMREKAAENEIPHPDKFINLETALRDDICTPVMIYAQKA